MTSELNEVVDFSVPIKTSGVSIVLRYPNMTYSQGSSDSRTYAAADVGDDGLLFIVRPLSLSVWIMLVVVYVAVSTVVHLSERLTPPPLSPSVVGDQLLPTTTPRPTFGSSALAVLSTMTLLRAASVDPSTTASLVVRPRTVTARLLIVAVGVFSVVLLVAYAVNMAALRLHAAERRPSRTWWPVHVSSDDAVTRQSLQDLVQRPDIEFVTAPAARHVTSLLLDGSGEKTAASLRRRIEELTDGAPRQRQSSRWIADGGAGRDSASTERTVQEALGLVDGSGRAFVGDTAAATYAVARDCDLVEYRLLSETRFFAIGMSRHSRFRDPINAALLTLRERGAIHQLQTKYARMHFISPFPLSNSLLLSVQYSRTRLFISLRMMICRKFEFGLATAI